MVKQFVKKIIYIVGLLPVLDKFIFYIEKIKNLTKNRQFKKENPQFNLPPDYFLYETYQLNYEQYKTDGLLSAQEIAEWVKPYINFNNANVLEWGCGVSRIVRHLPQLLINSNVFGADINATMISWNKKHIADVNFDLIDYYAPTKYPSNNFGLIYAISVFTHIESFEQENWIKEIKRILVVDGVFLFTTHGEYYFNQLNGNEKISLQKNGAITKSYKQKGHRMMSTYNEPQAFTSLLQKYFEVLEYYSGRNYPQKVGGQDLWIVKKKTEY